MSYTHRPVMLSEVLEYLDPSPGDVICDATCGGGGHSLDIARKIGESGVLIGIDLDPQALNAARQNLEGVPCRVILARGNYGDMAVILEEAGYPNPNGILFDFGVSSHQLDTAERGFTYRAEAPLDMRMDPDGPVTAADILNTASEGELEDHPRIWRGAMGIANRRIHCRATQDCAARNERGLSQPYLRCGSARGEARWATSGAKNVSGFENRSQ